MTAEQFIQWLRIARSNQPVSYLRQPLVIGIVNVTPNSFSDGGHYLSPEKACLHALDMIKQGADIIDVGGEASNPGALAISVDEELSRVIPVINRIREVSDCCISIDTYKAEVMQEAVAAGANLINDIYALSKNKALFTAAQLNVPVCLMHMQGTPESMQVNPNYEMDVVDEINMFFEQRIQACLSAGIKRENIIIDPGFGFGKTVRHNLTMLNRLLEFQVHQLPVFLGVSRKSTIGFVLDKPVDKRLSGSLAITVFAALRGVTMIRTHDVDETKQALSMLDAICNNGEFIL